MAQEFPEEDTDADADWDVPDELSPDLVEAPPPLPSRSIQVAESPQTDLLSLEAALEKIPPSLRRELEDQLRAEFREVRRWKG